MGGKVKCSEQLRYEACSAITSSPFTIMDVEMPELDGLAATRQMRADRLEGSVDCSRLRYGANQYRDHAIAAGCNEYVSLSSPRSWRE